MIPGRVLQAQDHPMLAHASNGAFQVRRQDVFPPESLLFLAGLIKKAVGCLGFDPARTGARDARRRLGGKSARHMDQPLGQTTVSEFRSAKFLRRPLVHAHRLSQKAHTLSRRSRNQTGQRCCRRGNEDAEATMTEMLTDRYEERLAGVLSCYDRIMITGTLPGACYAAGMTSFLNAQHIPDF
jgi:hypothetical protein